MLLPLLLPLLLLSGPTLSQPSEKVECLRKLWAGGARPRKHVFSQFEEDGILEAIFECIGTTDKYFVEFGAGIHQCTTRNFRENHGWTGLMMDGGTEKLEINLRKEFMTAENIVELFEKYNVPKPKFDHLTTDIDMNTFFVLRSILAGGYRPRSVATEVNRNFAPTDSYAVEYDGDNMLRHPFNCYYGASALAFVRMMDHFGYTLVAFDVSIVNMFFLHRQMALDGAEVPFTYPQVVQNSFAGGSCWSKIHLDCSSRRWLHIGEHVNFTDPKWMELLPARNLTHIEIINRVCPRTTQRIFTASAMEMMG